MKVLDVAQGTPEWHKAREQAFTASLAPAIMGQGYNSRNIEMEYALGIRERDNSKLQSLFEEGHAAEAEARPVFEANWGLSVSPLVGVKEVDGLKLLASFDGITMDNDLVWEHKFTSKEFDDIPPLYYWQLEHQLLVSGAEMAVLTVTSRKDRSITHYAYKAQPERQERLIEEWNQWRDDLENFERKDTAWLTLAENYKDIDQQIKNLEASKKAVAKSLQDLAKGRTAMGGGVRVSVSEQWEQKQTPAAYIKEHEIDLPVTKLDKPKLNYRITVSKENQ
jgi:predicted phage-related endonuclease